MPPGGPRAPNRLKRGYSSYTVDSPATDEHYTPNPDAPEWDYRVVYEVSIDAVALGGAEFGGANIEFVHASPSKREDDTIVVEPRDCPPPRLCGEMLDRTCGPGEVPPPPRTQCKDMLDVDCDPGGMPEGEAPQPCDPTSDPTCTLG